MTDEKPPRRFESDRNFVLPPEVLAQLRESGAPPPELAEAMHEAQEGPHSGADTLVPCPICERCSGCDGTHMVSPEVRAEQERLAKTDPDGAR